MMILRATVYVTCLDQTLKPFPRAVLQEDIPAGPLQVVEFTVVVRDRIQAKWPRHRLEISFGPVGVPWSLQ